MDILVDRYLSTNEATLSHVYVNGEFYCFGLEDEFRAVKIPGETRIPAGSYKITLKTWGGFHERYKVDRRFREYHQGMLWVREVPDFENILIHVGNTEKDTAGCLLVGMVRDETRMVIYRSAEAYEKLYRRVLPAAEQNRLYVTYKDSDRS